MLFHKPIFSLDLCNVSIDQGVHPFLVSTVYPRGDYLAAFISRGAWRQIQSRNPVLFSFKCIYFFHNSIDSDYAIQPTQNLPLSSTQSYC